MAEHPLGKGKVGSPILPVGSHCELCNNPIVVIARCHCEERAERATKQSFWASALNSNMANNNTNEIKNITDFLFEVGTLKRLIRNSYQTLGSGGETVAEHSFRCALIGYCLAKMEKADENKIMKMCLFHDLLEARTGDQNWINKQYTEALKDKARKDQCQALPFGKEMLKLLSEWNSWTQEAILAKDADILEQMLQEKEYYESGNQGALDWMKHSKNRLRTKIAKQIAVQIMKGKARDWWWNLPPLNKVLKQIK